VVVGGRETPEGDPGFELCLSDSSTQVSGAGIDFPETGEDQKRLEDLAAFDLESLSPTDDSDSIDLGSPANMPTADRVLEVKAEPIEIEAEEGIDLETSSEKTAEEESPRARRVKPKEDEEDRPAKRKKADTRRATVRYYTRMNPERVYPLLVLITRDMVEKVQKKGTAQKSSKPFQVAADSPVEIEPVLPGCDYHPPKVTARLDRGDLTLTFRVVPHVMGRVDGASVVIRQDHTELAQIELDAKVVQTTWVAFSGALTFLLPGLSAGLKHFGLDFETQQGQGFNLYLATARLVFDRVSPLALTLGLGVLTGLLWWFTRPRVRDVFWEIETVGPGEKLRRIAAEAASYPQRAADSLLEFLDAYPDYQPAWLYYAEWHYQLGNYRASLKGYVRAFKAGVVKARHYLKASLAASRLGENQTALRILQMADRVLPRDQMAGLMLYNMGCYLVRVGELEQAMSCLRRAIAAGYRTAKSYRQDPDLDPLRSRPDFQRLLATTRMV
jgi:hypothetical protein